jgi:hypothetical protein
MRVILTAVMVVWLLIGCATPEEPEATAPSPRDTYLSFCPDVMHEISRYHDGFDRLVDTDDIHTHLLPVSRGIGRGT